MNEQNCYHIDINHRSFIFNYFNMITGEYFALIPPGAFFNWMKETHDLNMAIRVMKPIFQIKNVVINNKLELNIYNCRRNNFAHIFVPP